MMSEPVPDGPTTRELARASHKAHRFAEAVPLYQRAMRENPLDFDLWLRCGQAAADAGLLDLALPMLTTYARMSSSDSNAQYSLAYALFRAGRIDESAAAYRRSVALDPSRASAWCAIGQIAYMQGDEAGGWAAHDAALAVVSDAPLARFTTSTVRLLRGDYERGWADHEARWDVAQLPRSSWRGEGCRIWDGSDLGDTPLHLHAEGGYGDTLMLARYLPVLRDRGIRVRLHAQTGLEPLLRDMVDAYAPSVLLHHEPDRTAVHCGGFSLPHVLHTTIDTIPTPEGYLARELSAGPRVAGPLRVGLVWAGNPNVVHDFDRSAPSLTTLSPLFDVGDVEWTSLQIGARATEAEGKMLRPPPRLADYADTARLIADLDLVISVDTSVAHLAGAMGRPVWTMVPTAPEFRWMLDRTDTPWYRSMRLFRRTRTDAWAPMVATIATALADHRDRVAADG
jgi:TPR repeat/Glycosyltransferase family 9 (heptosyltransferase)